VHYPATSYTTLFFKDIFKLLIGPPIVSHDAKLLPLFSIHLQEGYESFHTFIIRLWNSSSVYMKVIGHSMPIAPIDSFASLWLV